MQWIERIERRQGEPHLVVVGPDGERGLRPFKYLRSAAPEPRGAKYVTLSHVALNDFRECDPAEYLALAGFKPSVSSDHRVYELRTASERLLVPASVMMLGVFSRPSQLAQWLCSAAPLNCLAVATFDENEPTLTFSPGAVIGGRDKKCFQERFLWLTGFPSARRAWSSVAINISAKRLAFDMPDACVNGSVRGLSRGDTVLVTRLYIGEVTPTELPLPNATGLAGKRFLVNLRNENCRKMRPDTLLDDALVPNATGWHTTDEEWGRVCELLGSRYPARARPRLDEILLKLGTGRAWDDINGESQARSLYFRLRHQGRWALIRERLVAYRTSTQLS